jgi:hypothetical protein
VSVTSLFAGALAAQLAGLILAADGFRRAWRQFRRPGDDFWGPLPVPIKSKARVAYRRIRRLIGKPVAPPAGTGGSTRASGSIPSMNDPGAFMEHLNRSLAELNDRMQQAESRIQANAGASAARHAEVTEEIIQDRQEAREQVRIVAIGGLREQVIGWVLIFAGTLSAGIGDLLNSG